MLAASTPADVGGGTRPGYHYTRPSGWMNDPVPFYDEEEQRFHLFHLCDPNSTKAPWAGGWQGWCHASSKDMASEWTTHDVAITAESPGTGSAVALPVGSIARSELGGARAAILTASAVPFAPELWVSSDPNLTEWRQIGRISLPNATMNVTGLTGTADVHVWRDEHLSTWRLVTSGLSARGASPVLLQYESPNSLKAGWRFTGVLYTGSLSNRLECPSYATLRDDGSSGTGVGRSRAGSSSALLVYSWPTRGYAQLWVSGTEASLGGKFEPLHSGQLEYGIGYAAEMTASWPGRLLLFSWLRGVSDGAAYVGAQSLTREMHLLPDGTATVRPAAELEALIVTASTRSANVSVGPGTQPPTWSAGGVPQQARVRVELDASGPSFPASAGITLVQNGSADRDEGGVEEEAAQLQMSVLVKEGSACVSIDPRQGCASVGAPISAGGAWRLRASAELWIDNGLIEVYVGNGSAVLSAFYPRLYSAATGLSVAVWAEGNATAKFGLVWSAVASAAFDVRTS